MIGSGDLHGQSGIHHITGVTTHIGGVRSAAGHTIFIGDISIHGITATHTAPIVIHTNHAEATTQCVVTIVAILQPATLTTVSTHDIAMFATLGHCKPHAIVHETTLEAILLHAPAAMQATVLSQPTTHDRLLAHGHSTVHMWATAIPV